MSSWNAIHSVLIQFFVIIIIINAENFAVINKLIEHYGDFFRVWIGPELNILISDPKDVEVSREIFIYNL